MKSPGEPGSFGEPESPGDLESREVSGAGTLWGAGKFRGIGSREVSGAGERGVSKTRRVAESGKKSCVNYEATVHFLHCGGYI